MLKSRVYFDNRRPDKAGCGQLRIVLTHIGQSAMLSLGISLQKNQWEKGVVINHPDAHFLNNVISAKKGAIDRLILEHSTLGTFAGKKMDEIVRLLRPAINPDAESLLEDKERDKNHLFLGYFIHYAEGKKNPGTRTLYMDTYKKLSSFCLSAYGTTGENLKFEEINKTWLEAFEEFCLKTERQNTASRHLRDIRAVFYSAIDNGLTVNYPFRKYKIKKAPTFDKSYTSQELRTLFLFNCYPGGEQEAVDMFKLMFCLIGINPVDLFEAPKGVKGRLNYIRKKTHKPYSIKIEPEAESIIQKYSGTNALLSLSESHTNYKTYFNNLIKTLRNVGKQRVPGKQSTGEAIIPEICAGAARTSWATIAQEELDIPRDVIAAALGHNTIDVTTTYLRTDWKKKVDRANRLVLDLVFYGKRTPFYSNDNGSNEK